MGGNKMRYGLFLLLSLFMWQACDVEDKGNYDYDYQNGVTITFADEEMNQTLEKGVDTLKIHPTVEGDIYGDNEDNYEYKWFFCSGKEHKHTEVGTTKNLTWPVVSFKPGNYTLYFQVIDKSTGLEWIKNTGVTIFSELTQGWVLLGEMDNGEARMDMLVQKPDNSIVLVENIFDNSELHLKGARNLIYTGNRSGKENSAHLWLMTDEKDMKVTWGNNFIPVGEFHEMMVIEEMEVSREIPRIRDMFPRQSNIGYGVAMTMRNYQSRGIITDSAIYMTTISISDGSEVYVNPMNRYNAYSKEFFKPYPMAFVQLGTRVTGNLLPLFYDMDEECFVRPGSLYGSNATSCVKLIDYPGDKFPWNQASVKRTIVYGENLRNSPTDYMCDCVALMKDLEGEDINYYIYRFRPGAKTMFNTVNNPTKVNGYTIDKAVAVDFDKATHYAFMSNAYVVLYSVGSTLYAYNYSYNTLSSMEMESDISCLKADAVLSNSSFWVTTYSGQKGELKLLQLGGAQKPELNYAEEDCWPVTMKVVDVEWKYGEDPAEEEPEEEGEEE